MTNGKRWFGAVAFACVACCSIPLLILGASGLAAIGADAWICGGVLLIGAAVWYGIARKQQSQGARVSTGADSCSKPRGCNSG